MSPTSLINSLAGTKKVKSGQLDWKKVGNWDENHIIKIAFRPYTEQKSLFATVTLGKLYVQFSKGCRACSSGIYLYENISYNQFYYLWKVTDRRGTYFHYYIRTTYTYECVD